MTYGERPTRPRLRVSDPEIAPATFGVPRAREHPVMTLRGDERGIAPAQPVEFRTADPLVAA